MPIWKSAGEFLQPEVFTRFATELVAGCDPEPAVVEELLKKLKTALIREIQRRSLWHASPSYLGVYGYRRWSDPEGDRGASAIEEFLLDAFTGVFIERLSTLRSYLEQGSSIETLIPHMLRNFVHDAQARSDRLGLRLFRLLRAAVRLAEECGTLEISGGDARVVGSTVLRVASSPGRLPDEDRRERWAGVVARWNDELLAELVTAPNRRVPAVVSRLAALLAELADAGLGTFRFGELLAALRFDARRRWIALFDGELGVSVWDEAEEPGAWSELCRAVEPEVEKRILEEDAFRHLIDCVARHIEEMEAPERTRDHLFRLWGFLRMFATEQAPDLPEHREGRLPSRRSLARWLELPRDRFAELQATLASFLTNCRSSGALEGGARP